MKLSSQEKEIRDLIYSSLGVLERYRLAMFILEEFRPIESLEVTDAMIEEYQARKNQYDSGNMPRKPWREVMNELLKDNGGNTNESS